MADKRGHVNFGWLDSRHTFSFGDYYDPAFMGFGTLRVINEDRVSPGAGFDTHGHRDMEIISYVLDGALEHKDSLGTGSIIRPGDVQRMTAGSGIRHSEYNHSDQAPVHFLQIWIVPESDGLAPAYEQKAFPIEDRQDKLRLLGSRDGRDGSVLIHQDVSFYGSLLASGQSVVRSMNRNRRAWLQVVRGELTVDSRQAMQAGDGLGITEQDTVSIEANAASEFLLFDLAA